MYWSVRKIVSVTMILLATTSVTVSAQQRVPDRGQFALGLNIGFAIPTEEVLDSGFTTNINGEYYVTPRLSIRGQFGGAWFSVQDDALDQKVKPMHLTGTAVYNWERGKIHPYAGGGIGWYHFRFGEEDGSTDSKFGVNLGGGLEYFLSRSDTIVGDVTFHIVTGDPTSLIFAYDGKFWTITGGYKKYF